jgi:hypothetical protein
MPVAVRVWAMGVPVPEDAPDTSDSTTVQLYVVPGTVLVKAIEGAAPEQIVFDDGVAVTAGIGLTVMTTVFTVPLHPLADEEILYVAVPVADPVVVRIWAIVSPLPAKAPETPDWTTVHENVVPATLLVSAMDGAVAEHMVWAAGVAVTTGVGLTVITALTGIPMQLLAVGVIV